MLGLLSGTAKEQSCSSADAKRYRTYANRVNNCRAHGQHGNPCGLEWFCPYCWQRKANAAAGGDAKRAGDFSVIRHALTCHPHLTPYLLSFSLPEAGGYSSDLKTAVALWGKFRKTHRGQIRGSIWTTHAVELLRNHSRVVTAHVHAIVLVNKLVRTFAEQAQSTWRKLCSGGAKCADARRIRASVGDPANAPIAGLRRAVRYVHEVNRPPGCKTKRVKAGGPSKFATSHWSSENRLLVHETRRSMHRKQRLRGRDGVLHGRSGF